MRFGEFDFVNLADLLWDLELALVCPLNLIGEVEVYLTTHHGSDRSGPPQLVHALNPIAAIMNNGPRKGGGVETWETLSALPGADAIWQVHKSLQLPDEENAPEDQIVNLGEGDEDLALPLVVTAQGDGSFVIENPRNGFTRSYAPH